MITPETIKKIVANHYGFDISVYEDHSRRGEIIRVKHIAIYFVYGNLKKRLSANTVGRMFGLKDHCLVFHINKKFAGYIETDRVFAREIEQLSEKIKKEILLMRNDYMPIEVMETFYLGKSIN